MKIKENKKEKKASVEKPKNAKGKGIVKHDKKNKIDKLNKKVQSNGLTKSAGLSSTPGEKPDWKVLKDEKKTLKKERKMKRLKSLYEVIENSKPLSEKLRRSDCSPKDRTKLIKELSDLFKGHFNEIIFSHDTSRIVQLMIKYGTPEIQEAIIDELKPSLLSMFTTKYSKNCLSKALKHGSDKLRQKILSSCNGNVVKLACNKVSAPLIDTAYKEYATEKTKNHFKQEFFGGIYKNDKDDNVKTLEDTYKNNQEMKAAILTAVKKNIARMVNKNLINCQIAHSVMAEFLQVCSNEDRAEIIQTVRDLIFELSKTKEGAKVAMICVWHGSVKDRKFALKAMKDHVVEIATSEHGHLILMAVFDALDDTVLIKKVIFSELLDNLETVVANEFGKKVILYLVARRDTLHFHPMLIEQLKKGDGNATSKKETEVREKELVSFIINPLLESIIKTAANWLANSSMAMVTLSILKAGDGDKLKEAFDAIAKYIVDPNSILNHEKTSFQAVEHPGLHLMLKKLIAADKINNEKGKHTFGDSIIDQLDDDLIKKWFELNRACFLFVTLIENESESSKNNLISKLKPLSKVLKKQKHTGGKILLEKIK